MSHWKGIAVTVVIILVVLWATNRNVFGIGKLVGQV